MKSFVVLSMAAVTVFAVSGCRWCFEPQGQDPSCMETSHILITKNSPSTTSMVTPNIAISREVFRPVFRAGTSRVTVMGAGGDREDATMDAIAKFLAQTKCDYIVSVSTVAVKNIHPTPWWYFFIRHSNYSVTFSGVPVYLDKLSCETLDPKKVDAYDANTGVFIPTRGYDSTPVKATRALPELPKVEAKITEVPVVTKVSVVPEIKVPSIF